jgi:hypothetical protein
MDSQSDDDESVDVPNSSDSDEGVPQMVEENSVNRNH